MRNMERLGASAHLVYVKRSASLLLLEDGCELCLPRRDASRKTRLSHVPVCVQFPYSQCACARAHHAGASPHVCASAANASRCARHRASNERDVLDASAAVNSVSSEECGRCVASAASPKSAAVGGSNSSSGKLSVPKSSSSSSSSTGSDKLPCVADGSSSMPSKSPTIRNPSPSASVRAFSPSAAHAISS